MLNFIILNLIYFKIYTTKPPIRYFNACRWVIKPEDVDKISRELPSVRANITSDLYVIVKCFVGVETM
jgi:hypothetical protein